MTRRILAHFCLASLVILISAGHAYAQGGHKLEGKVFLPNNMAPPNSVKVTLTFNGRRVYETFTDLSGRFVFGGLGKGTYQLTAEGDGNTFENTSVYAEVSAFGNAPQTFTQNIQLRLKPGKHLPRAAVVSAEDLDAGVPEVVRKQYQKAIKLAKNEPEKSIKLLQETVAAHPQFYPAHVALGDQYAKLNRFDEAMAAYQKAIELKGERADAHIGLGVTLVKQKKYTESLAPLRRGVELERQTSTPYLFLGLAEMMTGDYAAAEANLLRAFEIDKPALSHIYLANLYELRGEPAKAIKHLQDFLKENPSMPEERQAQVRQAIEKLRKQMPGK